MFMLPVPLRHSDNHQLPPIQANTHSFTQVNVCVCAHTQTVFSTSEMFPLKFTHSSPRTSCCYHIFIYLVQESVFAIFHAVCCQSYRAVVNGCPGWHRGRGRQERREKRTREEKSREREKKKRQQGSRRWLPGLQ